MHELIEALWDIGAAFNLRHNILPAEVDAIRHLRKAAEALEPIPYIRDSHYSRHEAVGVRVRDSIHDLWAWVEVSP